MLKSIKLALIFIIITQNSIRNTLFKYKGDSEFRNIFDILSELLGLSSPILVKDVMFSPTEIVIKVTDEYEAKQKFLSSINEVQKTLLIKRRKN